MKRPGHTLSRVPSTSDGLWVWVPHLPTFHFTLSSAGHSKFSSCQEALGLSVFAPFSLRERERDSPGKESQAPTCSPSSLRLVGFCRQHLYSQWSLFPTWGYTFQIPVSLTSLMTEATPFPRLFTGSVAGATQKVMAGPWTDPSDRTQGD